MSEEFKKAPYHKGSSRADKIKEINELDRKMLKLLSKRSRLLASAAPGKGGRGFEGDSQLEKRLWQTWEHSARDHDLESRLLRTLFVQTNLFASSAGRGGRRKDDPYLLTPQRKPVNVSVPGPRSLETTRAWAVMAAAAGVEVTLTPVVLNDPLIELIKGLNEAGGALSWEDDFLTNREGEGLDFEDKLVFCGDAPFTFYALLCLSLAGAGRCKFAGGAPLKLLDARSLNKVLNLLGARIQPLNPHAPGLPVRLECGGRMASRIDIPEDMDPRFVAALALCAWRFKNGLTLEGLTPVMVGACRKMVAVLKTCGISAELEGSTLTVKHGQPELPGHPELPLDPDLSAWLLALPAFNGGEVKLSGALDSSAPETAQLLGGLKALGAEVSTKGAFVVSTKGVSDGGVYALGRDLPHLFPLTLVLGLATGKEFRAVLPDDEILRDEGLEMLDRMGAATSVEDGEVKVGSITPRWTEAWSAPGPETLLGMALAALIKPGAALENPGDLTTLWPKFWNLYNTLPDGVYDRPKEEPKDDDGKKRKRVRIG